MEGAYQSCSWGIGQVMGFNARKLGYPSAIHMVNAMKSGGIRAQMDAVIRYIKVCGVVPHLVSKNWEKIAELYNGPAYAQNDYDTRLEAAYMRWMAKDQGIDEEEEIIPLGRTPVQNAEPGSAWKTPEGAAAGAAAAGTVVGAVKPESKDGKGPMDYALAIAVVVAVCVGAYFFIKRLRRNPE